MEEKERDKEHHTTWIFQTRGDWLNKGKFGDKFNNLSLSYLQVGILFVLLA